MPSSLPTDDALTKSVDDFGIGPYDAMNDDQKLGENDESGSSQSLPGIPDTIEYEPYIGYPQHETSQGKHATFAQVLRSNPVLAFMINGSSSLPGTSDVSPPSGSPNEDTKGGALAPTNLQNDTGSSELPSDANNPAARSDYYDRMQTGQAISDMFADEDAGVYADESLPTSENNTDAMGNYLSPLGNSDSGYIIEDQSNPKGFPSDDFDENADFSKSNDGSVPGGTLMAFEDKRMNRTATDHKLVTELTSKFLKDHGKKNLTRRAVTAFLQSEGMGDRQYIASDIVRCLKHNHNIVIPDVLDTFPVRTASNKSAIRSIKDDVLDLEFRTLDNPRLSRAFGHISSELSNVMKLLED